MRIILLFVGLFVGLAGVAMAYYPGGNWMNRRAQEHDLARNFLCDLLGPVAMNGQPNPTGSVAMQAALAVAAAGLAVTLWMIPKLLEAPRIARTMRVCAGVSLVGLLAVPMTPPSRMYALHIIAVVTGGVPAMVAWGLALYGLGRQPRTRGLANMGLLALLGMAVAFVLYAYQLFARTRPNVILPLSHRVATVLCLAWLVRLALTRVPGQADGRRHR